MNDEISRLRGHIGPVIDGAMRETVEDEIKSADSFSSRMRCCARRMRSA